MLGRSDSAAVPKAPSFPTFLLPSIPIPFRRRKTDDTPRSPTAASPPGSFASGGSIASPAAYRFSLAASSAETSSSLPSLCTSPASTTGTTPPSSPTSPARLFPPIFGLGTAAAAARPPSPHSRLTRALPDTLRCSTCSADVALTSQIVSKGFTGRHGRAFLVSPPPLPTATDLANIRVGRQESRQLVTGAHVVADISCAICSSKLGWKYVDAREPAQKYKVGKFILETARVMAFRSWGDIEQQQHRPAAIDEAKVLRQTGATDNVDAAGSWLVDDGRHEQADDGGDSDEGDAEGEVLFDSDDEDECEDIFAGTWDAHAVAKRRRGKITALRKKQATAAATAAAAAAV